MTCRTGGFFSSSIINFHYRKNYTDAVRQKVQKEFSHEELLPYHSLECVRVYASFFTLFQKENIHKLTNSVVEGTRRLCPHLEDEAIKMATKYNQLFRLFGICHRQYNTADTVTEDQIKALGEYLPFSFVKHPSKITLTQHYVFFLLHSFTRRNNKGVSQLLPQ